MIPRTSPAALTRVFVFVASLGLLLAFSTSIQALSPSRPAPLSLRPAMMTAHSTVTFQNGASPTSSYTGTTDALITTWNGNAYANLGGLDYLQVGEVGDEDQFRSLIRFDLQGWPGMQVHVDQAWLELVSYDGGFDDAPQDVLVHQVTRSWLEGTGRDLFADGRDMGVTWTTARPGEPWTTPGGDFRPDALARIQVPANAVGWQRWDVTEAVREWVDAPEANHGLLLEPEGAPWTHHEFRSSEWQDPSQRPRLVVQFTYEILYLPLLLPFPGGTLPTATPPSSTPTATATATLMPTSTPAPSPTPTIMPSPSATPTLAPPAQGLIQPSDLHYLGAFRLPADPQGQGWEWANWSSALTYYPQDDPQGADDGFPGSLFGVGADPWQRVAEIDIPAPVRSPTKNVADLPTARLLQPFADIRQGLVPQLEMPRVGLAYLPAHGSQRTGKLYFAWADHAPGQPEDAGPTHGWAELTLDSPQSRGLWAVGGYPNYVTGDYLFDIPQPWADAVTQGRSLATGRYRDGGQAAEGPALFAIAPWAEGNPPSANAVLPATRLLLYENVMQPNPHALNGYHHSDEWTGGAWLSAGDRAAVIFVGTKGVGDNWYGCADGTDQPPWPDDCDRGWWSTGFEAQMLFYDPNQLAAVARGEIPSWQPQPYATLVLDPALYHITSSQQKYHVAAIAFDRGHGLLYVLEPLADEDRPLVHVWRVR